MKTKRVPLVVTEEHITRATEVMQSPGFCMRSRVCPAAQALSDQYGGEWSICQQGALRITPPISRDEGHTHISLELASQISKFDHFGTFRSGVYFLDMPEELASK